MPLTLEQAIKKAESVKMEFKMLLPFLVDPYKRNVKSALKSAEQVEKFLKSLPKENKDV